MRYLLIALALLAVGCTQNQRARSFGGTAKITLPCNVKLVTATWKQDQLWYLTRPMETGEKAGTYQFHEESSYGLIQGDVIFTECTF